jgi:hypothetical protein
VIANIGKRKPDTGSGWMEFFMLTHEEKLTLVRDLIDAGVTDPTVITESIKHLEKELFNKS